MPQSDAPQLLLVEGPDDKHVVRHLMGVHKLPCPFEIRDAGGIGKVRDAIPVDIRVAGRKALGILVDANDDVDARWQSLGDTLRKSGYQLPSMPEPAGTTLTGPGSSSPKVGVWLMPDNKSEGEIEDFVRRLIPEQDTTWPKAEDYVGSIPIADRKFLKGKETRAKLYAWLAVREEPRMMGAAISRGDLDAHSPLAKALIAWLGTLFDGASMVADAVEPSANNDGRDAE